MDFINGGMVQVRGQDAVAHATYFARFLGLAEQHAAKGIHGHSRHFRKQLTEKAGAAAARTARAYRTNQAIDVAHAFDKLRREGTIGTWVAGVRVLVQPPIIFGLSAYLAQPVQAGLL